MAHDPLPAAQKVDSISPPTGDNPFSTPFGTPRICTCLNDLPKLSTYLPSSEYAVGGLIWTQVRSLITRRLLLLVMVRALTSELIKYDDATPYTLIDFSPGENLTTPRPRKAIKYGAGR